MTSTLPKELRLVKPDETDARTPGFAETPRASSLSTPTGPGTTATCSWRKDAHPPPRPELPSSASRSRPAPWLPHPIPGRESATTRQSPADSAAHSDDPSRGCRTRRNPRHETAHPDGEPENHKRCLRLQSQVQMVRFKQTALRRAFSKHASLLSTFPVECITNRSRPPTFRPGF